MNNLNSFGQMITNLNQNMGGLSRTIIELDKNVKEIDRKFSIIERREQMPMNNNVSRDDFLFQTSELKNLIVGLSNLLINTNVDMDNKIKQLNTKVLGLETIIPTLKTQLSTPVLTPVLTPVSTPVLTPVSTPVSQDMDLLVPQVSPFGEAIAELVVPPSSPVISNIQNEISSIEDDISIQMKQSGVKVKKPAAKKK